MIISFIYFIIVIIKIIITFKVMSPIGYSNLRGLGKVTGTGDHCSAWSTHPEHRTLLFFSL